jgi:uncharacterized protein YlxW (UPF0749 family)
MDDDCHKLKHELANAEQKNFALEKLVEKAANQIDALAEADCSDEAVEVAQLQAQRLRKAIGATDAAQ